MTPQNLLILQYALGTIIILSVIGTVYTFISPSLARNRLKNRIKGIHTTRDSLRRQHLQSLDIPKTDLRGGTRESVKKLVTQLSLEKVLEAENLRDHLAMAGLRGERPIYIFYFSRLLLPIGFGLFSVIFFIILNTTGWSPMTNILASMGMVTFGYYFPNIWVSNLAQKRQNAIIPIFPDALDLLLICVEAGMSIEMAFSRVAHEMISNSIELTEELSITTAELSFLQNRTQAYENLGRRNKHAGIRAVATALAQAERYGTPLSDIIRTLSQENRELRVIEAEKKAAALPAKMTVPMIVFFLPIVFIVVLTPVIMRVMDAFQQF